MAADSDLPDERANRRRIAFAVAGISVVALVLRAIHLDRDELWFDEAFADLLAMQPTATIFDELARDSSPPLFFVLLRGWSLAVGADPRSLRLFSLFFGLLAIWLTVGLGTRLWSPRVGLIAGGLVAISPLHIYYSREVRPYALLTVFGLLSLVALDRLARQPRPRTVLLYIGPTLAAMYTHNYGLFLAAILGLWAVLGRVSAKQALTATAGLVLGYTPWIPVLVNQLRSGATDWMAPLWAATHPALAFPRTFAAFCIGQSTPDDVPLGSERIAGAVHSVAYVTFALLLARAVTAPEAWPGRRLAGIVAVLLAVPFALSFVTPIYLVGRHDVLALPLFLLLAAGGLATVPPKQAAAGALVIVMLATAAMDQYWERPPVAAGRTQAALLVDRAGRGDAIVAIGFTRNTVEDYVRLGGGRQSFFSFPLSFEHHRGWLDERGLADEGLLQREAERLTTTIEGAVEPEDRLWVVHSRQLARANELLMQRISAAFRQVPCPADGERLGLTCWKRPRL